MDERTCETCAYGGQSYNEYPCYVCLFFSKWKHIDEDDEGENE